MSTLPNKWAVEIQSLQDAERLQALFPELDGIIQTATSLYEQAKKRYVGDIVMTPCHVTGKYNALHWQYGIIKQLSVGYTIYNITELENLMKSVQN